MMPSYSCTHYAQNLKGEQYDGCKSSYHAYNQNPNINPVNAANRPPQRLLCSHHLLMPMRLTPG
jgi:hypothetical protein